MALVTSAVIGAAGAVYAANKASKSAKEQNKTAQAAIDAADPFKQYRDSYAQKLNALQSDPSSIVDSPEYKARIQAVQRQLAAQGYTGSGNALVEAADASGTVYQQAFTNLAMLSGADVGVQNAQQAYQNKLTTQQNNSNQQLSSISGITGALQGVVGAFNKPAGG